MQDEQCLYLNIFTPINKSNQSLLPVLVWIHGGGLISGCSSQSIPLLYNGTNIIANLPQQPVIIVTINYRLGVLGNMYLIELIEENSSEWPTAGNYFYLDMLSALRWVNKNIVDYGGNPNNVLIFGESSGGNAVVDIGALKGSSNLYIWV
jgi:carboxylesterase type B